jgi:hypothetical protein
MSVLLIGSLLAISIYCYVNRKLSLDREEFNRVVLNKEIVHEDENTSLLGSTHGF